VGDRETELGPQLHQALVRRGSFARSVLEFERAWGARKQAGVGADCVERKRNDERAESEASPKRADGDPIEAERSELFLR
jgi:hypothetical protein